MEDKYGYNEEEADDIINKLREQHKNTVQMKAVSETGWTI